MCCFSPVSAPFGLLRRLFGTPELEVSGTKIFGRIEPRESGAVQGLIYSMSLTTPGDVAMILPIPAARVADDALTFVDLSGYPDLFEHLEALFPQDPQASKSRGLSFSRSAPRPRLVVHSVGLFEASYVPSLGDFDRLDPRFQIPQHVWRQRPAYAQFGFAVFKLKKGRKQAIHPMAFRFETREPDAIYFPTLHIHDGALHARAAFDHTLYFQAPEGAALTVGDAAAAQVLFVSDAAIEREVSIDRALGLVAAGQPITRWSLRGDLPNGDARVRFSSASRGPSA